MKQHEIHCRLPAIDERGPLDIIVYAPLRTARDARMMDTLINEQAAALGYPTPVVTARLKVRADG